MTTRTTTRRTHDGVLLLAIVAGIVLGIVGMHGLTQPDSTHAAHQAKSAAAAMVLAGSATDQHGHEPSGPMVNCEVLICCVSVLIGGALLLWAGSASRRGRALAIVKRLSSTALIQVNSVVRPRPDLIRLSILRC